MDELQDTYNVKRKKVNKLWQRLLNQHKIVLKN